MVITYYGLTCFKLQSGEMVIAFDPFSKESGLTPPRFQAHVALVTKPGNPYHSNTEALTISSLLIHAPGEYETAGISIEGISAGDGIIYTLEWEGLRICHLGALSLKTLPDSIHERMGTPDILFVPVGGAETLDALEAVNMVNQIEPRIIIPTWYAFPGLRSPLLESPEAFLKEFGGQNKPEDKLVIKKKDIAEEATMLVLLRPLGEKN